MMHILMSIFQGKTERQKTNFLKETVEIVDLYKTVLKKKMNAQE